MTSRVRRLLSVAVNDGRPEEEHLAVVQPGDQPDAAGAGRADSRRDGLRQARVLHVRARGLLRQLRWVYAAFFLVLLAEFCCWLLFTLLVLELQVVTLT